MSASFLLFPFPFRFFSVARRLGTLCFNSAILSFKFVRYRFSIMLWAVFFGAGRAGGGVGVSGVSDSSSSSSVSGEDLRFFDRVSRGDMLPSGDGDDEVLSGTSIEGSGSSTEGRAVVSAGATADKWNAWFDG